MQCLHRHASEEPQAFLQEPSSRRSYVNQPAMQPSQTSPAAGQLRDLGEAQLQGRAAEAAKRLRHNSLVVCVPHVCLSCLQEAPQQQQQLPLPQVAQLARHTAHLGHQAHTLQGTKSAGQRTHLHTGPSRPEGDQAARQARTLQTAGVRVASDHGHWCAACLR